MPNYPYGTQIDYAGHEGSYVVLHARESDTFEPDGTPTSQEPQSVVRLTPDYDEAFQAVSSLNGAVMHQVFEGRLAMPVPPVSEDSEAIPSTLTFGEVSLSPTPE